MTDEEWRRVPDFPDYEISSHGRVLSHHGLKPRVLKPCESAQAKYLAVMLCCAGTRRHAYVHALVAEAFHGPRPEGQEVRHLDGNHQNNVASNLAYGTRSENVFDRVLHGTHHYARRTHCKWGHPFDEANTIYRASGRDCRTCIQQRNRETSRRRSALRAVGRAA